MKQKKKKRKNKIVEKNININNRLIKDRVIRDIRTLSKQQEEDYYKPKRVGSFWNNNYIEYERNGDKNSNLSLKNILTKSNLT